MKRRLCILLGLFFMAFGSSNLQAAGKLNLLIITVDDMSADSIGAFGCELSGTTPNIDRLAAEGLRFRHAHVQVGNCMPSRNVMWSGRYPHNNGVEGFYQVPEADYPVLADLMQEAGYYTAIRHKVSHSTPYHPYPAWDDVLDELPGGGKAHVKDPASYGVSTARGIKGAEAEGKPFCLVVNIADPHKPFYAQARNGDTTADPHVPTRVFTPDEPPTPGFLFEDPIVSKELAHYYSSVRRADDGVGHILKALEESGQADNTMVMFLSDHGMPLPFAKTQLYHHSTHTPLIIRWPGVVEPGDEQEHMVSAVDFVPTLLDVLGLEHPEGIDGRSFAPLLKGETQKDRDFVIKEYNENAGGSRDPMRAVQTRRLLYLFNPWSNGERVMATATTGTPTYRRMAELAKTDEYLAARHDLYQHRVVEELYDVENDPDCLVNLIDSPAHQEELSRRRQVLEAWMVRTGDHMLEVFRHREDPAVREAYVAEKEKEAEARKQRRRGRRRGRRRRTDLISLEVPKAIAAGSPVTVKVHHEVESELGKQLLHVTLKQGRQKRRVDRKVVEVSGSGTIEVTFDVPGEVEDGVVSFAAFIGKDYPTHLQHIHTGMKEVD